MSSTEMPEAEAIEKARNGDVTGYESLYHLHRSRVYSLCLRFTGNASDAEDLAQEVFLQVYRKISTFRGDAKFGSWLYRVAVNLALMHFRRRRPREVSLNIPQTLNPIRCSQRCAINFGPVRFWLNAWPWDEPWGVFRKREEV